MRSKPFIILVLLCSLVSVSTPIQASPWPNFPPAINLPQDDVTIPPGIVVDGSLLLLDVPPMVTNWGVLMPLRATVEAAGGEVIWEPQANVTWAKFGNRMAQLREGAMVTLVDGEQVTMEAPVMVEQGRLMVPLSFLRDQLGMKVGWKSDIRMAYIGESPFSNKPAVNVMSSGAADGREAYRSITYIGKWLSSNDGLYGDVQEPSLYKVYVNGFDSQGRMSFQLGRKDGYEWPASIDVHFFGSDETPIAHSRYVIHPDNPSTWTNAMDAWTEGITRTGLPMAWTDVNRIVVEVTNVNQPDQSRSWVFPKSFLINHASQLIYPLVKPVLAEQSIPVNQDVDLLDGKLKMTVAGVQIDDGNLGYLHVVLKPLEEINSASAWIGIDYDGGLFAQPNSLYLFSGLALRRGMEQQIAIPLGAVADARFMNLSILIRAEGTPVVEESHKVFIDLQKTEK